GGAGNDTMIGGLGNDTYVVDAATDVTTEAAAAGTDTVQSAVTWTLGANFEKLTLAGADTMIGGLGNDTYVVDDVGDVVTEAASAGTDLVQSSVTHTLAANVEK